ncbi:hypothetical protein KJ359_012060 [Pestalotiopsis sp. 9143b]|nr:hypothetical protein KJ359_012060 [Pestalotiopsis sp. 9143b]
MFRKLCGSESLKNVVIVTTKWDAVPIETGELREQDLMNKFLQPMLTLGAQQARHNNTLVSAQDVLRKVLGNRGLALKLQNELVDEKKTLGETEAGAAVGDDIDKLRAKYENEKEELMKLIKEENNETIRVLLQQEQQKLTAIQAKAEKDKQTLEASREEQMAAYEKRLEAIAKKTGESSGTVLMKSVGFTALLLVNFFKS